MQENSSTHVALYDNIHLLNRLLCDTLKGQIGDKSLDIIIGILEEAKYFHQDFTTVIQSIRTHLEGLSNIEILDITRAFSHFLNLTSIAEQYHRIRRQRWHQRLSHPAQPGSLEAVLPELIKKGVSKEKLNETITELNIELVLTAHPTEVTRRSIIHKHNEIADNLERLDREDLTPDERERVVETLHAEIMAAWKTEEIRDRKPTSIEEAKWGFAVVEESLWHAVPEFLRDLDRQLLASTGKHLPLEAVPVRFSSWMGGDRDGNPNVTASVTREVTLLARWKAADLYLHDIDALRSALSINECSPELRTWVGDVKEPYRAILRGVNERLLRTKQWAECHIERRELCPTPNLIYLSVQDLLDPLLICYRSLHSIGAGVVAQGTLLDIIRRVYCFGLTLLPLDIRQHSEKHLDVMDALTKIHNLGSFREWTEKKRQDFLIEKLADPGRFFSGKLETSKLLQVFRSDSFEMQAAELQECLDTFRVIAQQPRDSFGAYVISMAKAPSDVLTVLLLQKCMGVKQPIRIVPLFETLEDLKNAAHCIDALLKIKEYKSTCKGLQEVMIGYSDSAKDAGVLTAAWAQYQAQEAIINVAHQHDINIRFFHGRGGSVGRGGGPSHLAIRSLPPGSTTGQLRVTQQGEVIRHRFGLQKIAERTLSIYTTATLEASLLPQNSPKNEWREQMDALSATSLAVYQNMVKDNPDFIEYFKTATPLQELDKIAIASRPSRRRANDSIESLRAIPWVFAWTQNRLILPAWFGVGEALEALKTESLQAESLNAASLQAESLISLAMAWPYFSSVLSMVELGLSKASIQISEEYERKLTSERLWSLGNQFRLSFQETEANLLKILEEPVLLSKNPILRRSIDVRSPYLLPLHILQIELLYKSRTQSPDWDETLERALLVSIAGIAAGMHNTG